MNILLTNDDGYNSLGIKILKKKLEKYGTVLIVAPDSPRSGNSAALTINTPLQLEKVETNVYKCSGTPVDCVSMGLCCFDIEIDLVVSGCNHGWNISYDTMYSGTVGAALEALIFHKPAIAISADYGSDMSDVDQYFDEVWEYIQKNKLLSDNYLLNVNFPKNETKEIKLGTLYYRNDKNYFTKDSEGYHAYRHTQEDFSDDKDSDCYQVLNGIISIVPLSRTYFNKSIYDELNKKVK